MTPLAWPLPLTGGGSIEEFALCFDRNRPVRLLIAPALFDEANKLRRLTVETMRRLDGAGFDSFLPDLPGCGESLAPLSAQTPETWRTAMTAAAAHFGATHLLTLRGGALIAPSGLPGWRYAPVKAASILRQLLRARVIAAREAGRDETLEGLTAQALDQGIDLAGYRLSAVFIAQFQDLAADTASDLVEIAQDVIGGGGLWLRAEPDDSPDQADALAAFVSIGLRAAAP